MRFIVWTGVRFSASPPYMIFIRQLKAKCMMTDNRMTELTTIIEALTALTSAITWTVPNSTPSVESYLKNAWAAIDKLKDDCNDQQSNNQ